MTDFWNQTSNPVLQLPRGKEKTRRYDEILIETLRSEAPHALTKDELQRKCRIKRCRFVVILNRLIAEKIVTREGTGTKSDPYRYQLASVPPLSPVTISV